MSVLTALSLLALVRTSADDPPAAFYFIGCRLWELMLGVVLFLLIVPHGDGTTRSSPSAADDSFFALLGALCIGLAFVFAEPASFPWPWAVLPTLGTALILQSGAAGQRGAIRALLGTPFLLWIGKRSYSLYLWHWPILVLMRWTVGLGSALTVALAVVGTVLCATTSYRYVERPLRHDPWIEQRPYWQRIGGFLLLPVLGLLVVTYVFDHEESLSLSTVTRHAEDWYAELTMPYDDMGERQCEVVIETEDFVGGLRASYRPTGCAHEAPARTIYLLGDSHAGMVASMFEELSAEEGVAVELYQFPGCGYIDFKEPIAHGAPPGCLDFLEAARDHILDAAHHGDSVFLSSLRMERFGDQWAPFDIPDMFEFMYNPDTVDLRRAAFEDAKDWLRGFHDEGIEVVFMAPTPLFKAPPYRCADWFNAHNTICEGGTEQQRGELERLREPIVDSMRSLAAEFPNIKIWDPFPILCPDAVCRTQKDGRPLFFDGDHLSAYGNRVLYPDFKRFMLALCQAG